MASLLLRQCPTLATCSRPLLVDSIRAASGRWYPQPHSTSARYATTTTTTTALETTKKVSAEEEQPQQQSPATMDALIESLRSELATKRAAAAPVFAKPREPTVPLFELIPEDRDGRILVANYPLWEAAMQRVCSVKYPDYSRLTTSEKDVMMAHARAVKLGRTEYADPHRKGARVMTVVKLLAEGKCCGSACRHCPYGHENVPAERRQEKAWNGAYYV